jgi:hypothetical protein
MQGTKTFNSSRKEANKPLLKILKYDGKPEGGNATDSN